MRIKPVFSTLAFGIALAGLGVTSQMTFANDDRASAGGKHTKMTIADIHGKLGAAGYANIEGIERSRNEYEAIAVGPNGERVRVFLDRMTGKIVETRPGNESYERVRGCQDNGPQKIAAVMPSGR
jgi:hypothetical protein